MVKTIQEAVKIIEAKCVWQNQHFEYYGESSSTRRIPSICVDGQKFSPACIIFANHYNRNINDLTRMLRICKNEKCLSPAHYVSTNDLIDDGTLKDENGWNLSMRRKLLGQLNLLDVEPTNDCIIFSTSSTRKAVHISRKYAIVAPKLSLQLKLGRPLLPKMDASHLCHNRNCVQPSHLLEETHIANMERSYNDGKMKQLKLSNDNIKAIFENTTMSNIQLANLYGVSDATISNIRRGITHNRVTNQKSRQSKYVAVNDIRITAEDRNKLAQKLEQMSDKVNLTDREIAINPMLRDTVHWIPRRVPHMGDTYCTFSFKNGNRQGHVLAAIIRFSLDRFPSASEDETKRMVLHQCLEKHCCNPLHMSLGDSQQNYLDQIRDQTAPQQRTTDAETLKQIQQDLFEDKIPMTEIAKRYNVAYHFVQKEKQLLRKKGHVFTRKYLGKRKRAST